MKIAIMQPYFFPYVGYYQLVAAVDLFVVYDDVKYTKKGWISRNRMLQNGADVMFSLSLKGDSDSLDIRGRELAADFDPREVLNRIDGAYRRAPYFRQTFPLIEQILLHRESNLFRFLHYSIARTCEHLGISVPIQVSSDIAVDAGLRSQDRVLAICKAVGAHTYVNAIGGVELYSKEAFREKGIALKFIRSRPFEYEQFGNPFVPWLSIVDVMMFNPLDAIRGVVSANYELV